MKQSNHAPSPASWVKTTFWGWLLGIGGILVLSVIFDAIGLEGFQFPLGLGIGGGVGLLQWRKLKKWAGLKSHWMWASTLGMGIPFLLYDIVSNYVYEKPFGEYFLPACVFAGSLMAGIWQFSLLKNHHSGKVYWWIPISLVGWMMAAGTVLAISYSMQIKNVLIGFFVNLTLILSGGAVLGVVTAKTIMLILSERKTGRQPDTAVFLE